MQRPEGGWAQGGAAEGPPRSRWTIALGAFLIQLFIPTVFSAYGVLLEVLVRDNNSDMMLWRGLFPPILHITTRTLMDPLFSSTFSGQSTKMKVRAMFGVLLVVGSILMNIVTDVVCLQIFTFGIIGGLSTSLVVAQADAALACHFPSQRGLAQVVAQLGLALGHFGLPLLANGLLLAHGVRGGVLLWGGAALHALVGAALLSPPTDDAGAGILFAQRPRAHTIDGVELREFSSNEQGSSGRSPLLIRDRSWKNPALASDSRYDIPRTNSISAAFMRHRTTNGVDILPEIPEESEESDEPMVSDHSGPNYSTGGSGSDGSSDVFTEQVSVETVLTIHANNNITVADSEESEERFCTKSLQKWRNSSLESEANDTVDEATAQEGYEQISHFPDASDVHTVTSSTSDVLRSRRLDCYCHCTLLRKIRHVLLCSCCSNTCIYDVFIATINVPNNLRFFVVEPFIEAIKIPYFFPAALFHSVSFLCPVLFATFVPSLVRTQLSTHSPQEGAFSISIAAFSSLCFLLFSPYILQSQVTTKRVIYFIGSIFLTMGLNIVSTTHSHSLFALGCTFFGLGHGATLGTTTYVLEEALGVRTFLKVQGPLGFMAGCFILLASVLLGFVLREENGLNKCFVALSAFQATTNILLIVSFLKTCLKSRWFHLQNISSAEWQPNGSFLTPD